MDQGSLTLGDMTSTSSNPQSFFGTSKSTPSNLVLEDGTTFRVAASTTANASLNALNSLGVSGNVEFVIYRTASGGTNSESPSFTVDGTLHTPVALDGTLTIDAAGNIGGSTPRLTVGGLTLTGDSIIQVKSNSTYSTNFTAQDSPLIDNGHSLTFYGEGSATQLPGAGIRLNFAGGTSVVTGDWTIGSPDGTQGVIVSIGAADNTSFTTGNITVNPYGQLMLFKNNFTFGTVGQTLTLNGIGDELADFSAGIDEALEIPSGNVNTYVGNSVLATDSIIDVAGTGELTLTGTITGPGRLQKAGQGDLIVLSSENTTPVNVLVANGRITVGDGSSAGAGNALLPDGDLTLGETSPTSGTTVVNFRNTVQTIGNLASTFAATTGTSTQTIMLSGTDQGGTVLTIDQTTDASFGTGAVSTLTSTITGVGSIVLGDASTATLTFTGTNDYTGGTTINGGKLALAGGATIGRIYGGDVAVNANGILGVSDPANLVGGNPLPPTGANTNATALINSGGTMSIDSDFDASVLLDPASTGILALNTDSSTLSGVNGSSAFIGAIGSQSLTMAALAPGAGDAYRLGGRGGTLTLANGVLTGETNSLVVGSTQPNGSGTVVLAAANSFGDGTTVNNGTLRTTADGSLGAGGLAVNGPGGAVAAAAIESNETVASLSSAVSGGSASLGVASGKTLSVNQAGDTTFAATLTLGAGATLGTGGTLAKSGSGSLEIDAAPQFGDGSVLQVNGGTLKFNVTSGSTTIGTGVAATVAPEATLELAGSVSVLDTTGSANRVNVVNDSSAPAGGLHVSGTNQSVGAVSGAGKTVIDAGADLSASSISQSALVIGGTAENPALVTLFASDSSGNPLAAIGGASAGDSLLTGAVPVAEPSTAGMASLPIAGDASPSDITVAAVDFGGSAPPAAASTAVPEPSTWLLAISAALSGAIIAGRRRWPRPAH